MKNKIIIFLLSISLIGMFFYSYNINQKLKKQTEFIETEYVMENGTYVNVYKDKEISDLKKENKTLYDSLTKVGNKDNIQYVTQFDYSKEYKQDTVYIVSKEKNDSVDLSVFHYTKSTDSISYTLSLCQEKEPSWYILDFKVNDKFTIVNRNENGINQTTIGTQNGGNISNVTVFNKKEKTFKDRFTIGPQIGIGYGLVTTQKIDIFIGVGLTYKF